MINRPSNRWLRLIFSSSFFHSHGNSILDLFPPLKHISPFSFSSPFPRTAPTTSPQPPTATSLPKFPENKTTRPPSKAAVEKVNLNPFNVTSSRILSSYSSFQSFFISFLSFFPFSFFAHYSIRSYSQKDPGHFVKYHCDPCTWREGDLQSGNNTAGILGGVASLP